MEDANCRTVCGAIEVKTRERNKLKKYRDGAIEQMEIL